MAEFSGDSDYTLDLDFNDSPPSDDAPDTRFSANTVSLNTSLSGSIGNGDQYDVYRLEPSSNGEITASLTGLAADADLRILVPQPFPRESPENCGSPGFMPAL